ncbi:Carbohydrate-selective porin OprB, partial [mine drainage metagenome]
SVHWGRSHDRLGIALGIDGLSALHRDYLAACGCGIMLCDGTLDDGHERVIEACYRAQLRRHVQPGPDLQWIANPGYNRARGPARVIGVRDRRARARRDRTHRPFRPTTFRFHLPLSHEPRP